MAMTEDKSWETKISAFAALDEPTRRRLYDYVICQSAPVSRDDAAAAVQLPRNTAAFHLERLVDEGLLSVVYERRTGRTGPGSGRPSKLYQRSQQQFDLSLPERRYELAGRLFAASIEEATNTGESPRAVLERRAAEVGRELGTAVREATPGDRAAVVKTLARYGFEPRTIDDEILLGNCPFHRLAQQHTDLVCGMNLCLLGGLLDGLAVSGLSARLEPSPDLCCVRLQPADEQR
ncbi:helix-turn-helix transcriptional regulator [Antrihabitans stalactiti]|nr:helix-turn-helix domain-containing protein [Antrihabitans stalactiti]